jgi:hypothetical protein
LTFADSYSNSDEAQIKGIESYITILVAHVTGMPVSERCVQLALLWPSQQHDDPALPKLKIKRCFTRRKEMKINLQCKMTKICIFQNKNVQAQLA